MFQFLSLFWLSAVLNTTYAYQNESLLHYWPIVLFLARTTFITCVAEFMWRECDTRYTSASYTNENPFRRDSCCFDGQEVKIEYIGFIAAAAAVLHRSRGKWFSTFSLLVVAISIFVRLRDLSHLCRFLFFFLISLILFRMCFARFAFTSNIISFHFTPKDFSRLIFIFFFCCVCACLLRSSQNSELQQIEKKTTTKNHAKSRINFIHFLDSSIHARRFESYFIYLALHAFVE